MGIGKTHFAQFDAKCVFSSLFTINKDEKNGLEL